MGWSPAQTSAASLWQYLAAITGWRAANGGDDEDGLTDSEFAALGEALDEYEGATVH